MSKGLTGSEGPIRTCIGCLAKKNKRDLIRLALDDAQCVVWDLKGNKPGRGVYICPNEECLAMAVKNKRFHRAFRRQVNTEALALEPLLRAISGKTQGSNCKMGS